MCDADDAIAAPALGAEPATAEAAGPRARPLAAGPCRGASAAPAINGRVERRLMEVSAATAIPPGRITLVAAASCRPSPAGSQAPASNQRKVSASSSRQFGVHGFSLYLATWPM